MSGPPPPQPAPPASNAPATPASPGETRSALHDPVSILRFALVIVGGVTLDLWSKHWAFHTIGQNNDRILIPNVLEFHITLNAGALFGLGQGQTTLFVIASFLALGLVLWMFSQCPARRWFTQIALGAILAGALGNMYDRINVRLVPHRFGPDIVFCEVLPGENNTIKLREYPPLPDSRLAILPATVADQLPDEHGYVRDFIKISQKWFGGKDVWPWVFNVADMLLVGGVCVLAIRLLRDGRDEESTRAATRSDNTPAGSPPNGAGPPATASTAAAAEPPAESDADVATDSRPESASTGSSDTSQRPTSRPPSDQA